MRLAVEGGKPSIPADEIARLWPRYGWKEIVALHRVLRSGIWSRSRDSKWNEGEAGLFEQAFRQYTGAHSFTAVANGTLAIELGLQALGVASGDEVLVPASTFFGSVTPILRLGAVPVFVDIEPGSVAIDPDCLRERITSQTRGVIVVHLCGIPANLDRIPAICNENSLFLLEDCAQAVGSRWRERHVGTFGEVGAFSFHHDKVLAAGEGGGIVTSNEELAGIVYALQNGFYMEGAPPGKNELSTNARITPWQASILRCQLTRLGAQASTRMRNVSLLRILLQEEVSALEPFSLPTQVTDWAVFSAPFRYNASRAGGLSRSAFLRVLRAEGIPAHEGHIDPVYRRPLFLENPSLFYRNDGCPHAESLSSEVIVISHRFFLGPTQWMERLAEVVHRVQRVGSSLRRRSASWD